MTFEYPNFLGSAVVVNASIMSSMHYLLAGMKTISGSITGGTKDTQEMMDFCAAHGIHPMIEVIPIQYANEAINRLLKRDVKYRFVIDIENSLK